MKETNMDYYISFVALGISLVVMIISSVSVVYGRITNRKIGRIAESVNMIEAKPIEVVSESSINIVLSENSFEKVNKLIDSLIVEAITIYYVMTGVVEETYINNKSTDEMKEYVFATVKSNMTPTVVATIKLFYNIDTDEKLNQLLLLRIKLHLIQEITEQNLPIQN